MSRPALADACAVIAYFTSGGAAMTDAGRSAMRADVVMSPITVWELARKIAIGKLPCLVIGAGSLARALSEHGFDPHPLTWADAERANALPRVRGHRAHAAGVGAGNILKGLHFGFA